MPIGSQVIPSVEAAPKLLNQFTIYQEYQGSGNGRVASPCHFAHIAFLSGCTVFANNAVCWRARELVDAKPLEHVGASTMCCNVPLYQRERVSPAILIFIKSLRMLQQRLGDIVGSGVQQFPCHFGSFLTQSSSR